MNPQMGSRSPAKRAVLRGASNYYLAPFGRDALGDRAKWDWLALIESPEDLLVKPHPDLLCLAEGSIRRDLLLALIGQPV
jgi:hypothetical protein